MAVTRMNYGIAGVWEEVKAASYLDFGFDIFNN